MAKETHDESIMLTEINSLIEAEVSIWKQTKFKDIALFIESALKFTV